MKILLIEDELEFAGALRLGACASPEHTTIRARSGDVALMNRALVLFG